MKILITATVTAACLASLAAAERNDRVWFEAVDVYIDSRDAALGAYQFEFTDDAGRIRIVGIEGGEVDAYAEPPHYDAKALAGGRIIIAAYSTADDLPTGRTRVVTIHVQVSGDADPEYTITQVVAGDDAGRPIEVDTDVATQN